MNTIIYFAVAVLAVALPLRAWLQRRQDPLRLAFTMLGLNLAWVYGSFGLYLVRGHATFDLAHAAGAALLPGSLESFLRVLVRPAGQPSPPPSRLRWVGLGVALVYLALEAWIGPNRPGASPADVLLGIFVFAGMGLSLFRVAGRYRSTGQRVTRGRLAYLLAVMSGAWLFSAVEALVRALTGLPQHGGLDLLAAPVVLHGPIPPVGVLFTGVLIYFMHQVLVLYRLLDLHEIGSRFITMVICGLLLVVVQGLAVVWNAPTASSPVHATWLMLVATLLFLAIYDPLRRAVEVRTGSWLNRRGQVLGLTLLDVDRALAKAISLETAFEAVLDPLASSGRVPFACIYLWDQERHQFVLAARRGTVAGEPMDALPPFTLAGPDQEPSQWLVRRDLLQLARTTKPGRDQAGQGARLMMAQGVDVLLPLTSGQLVLGWLGLADEPWSDGFSQEELGRLRRTADRLAVVLENIHGFEHLQEQHRLAGLGTMAAGLAHEIRNPLAGIKGAAQYLALRRDAGPQPPGSVHDAEQDEFVGIIIDEVDRLDLIVSRFLQFARPLQVSPEPVDVNEVVQGTAEILRRQGLPAGVELHTDLAEALPAARGDATLLAQVVSNLALNALQAAAEPDPAQQPDGPAPRVELRTRAGHTFGHGLGPSSVDIVVRDNGPGLPDDDRDKLFLPFYTRREGGTGLGLAITRRIVHAHGGEIHAGDTPGGGACFTVHLPLELGHQEG